MKKSIKFILVFLCVFLSCSVVAVKAETEGIDANENTQGHETVGQENPQKKQEQNRIRDKKIKAQQKEKQEVQKEKQKAKKLAEAKQKAVREIDRAIKKLNKIKERVQNMHIISSDLKTQLNAKIDEWIAKFNTRKTAVNSATTKEELKSAMEGFKADVKEAKRVIKDIVAAIHKTHLQEIIAKIEAFIPKVEEKVATITDAIKKAEATDLVSDAKTQIANAKTLVDAGKIEEAKKAIKTAHRDLKNAMEIVNEGDTDE